MENPSQKLSTGCVKTKLALLTMNLFGEPLSALYSLFPFILRKDLSATTYQITLFITLRPILSVFAFYWGAYLTRRKNKLLRNLIGAWVLARLPFLLFPFFSGFWFLFFSCGVYQLFSKAATPALIEILKRKIPKKPRETIFSFYYILSFCESVLLGVLFGYALDLKENNWKLLFVISALIGLCSVFFQKRIEVDDDLEETESAVLPKKNHLIQPIKDCWELLKKRRDFAHFQLGYMMGGMALMIIAPALSLFYVDVLALSHTEITIARMGFMGIGVVCSTFLWRKGLEKLSIFLLTSLILFGFALFILTLLVAPYLSFAIHVAFFIYGFAQSGSHLLWNLSGTLFADKETSVPFTTLNVLTIGVRGAIGPILGGIFSDLFGPVPVLILGAFLAICGMYLMAKRVTVTAINSV